MGKKKWQLVLLDDDVNSFEDVIDSLCEVLGHNIYQAEQCAMLVHNNGQCVIHSGDEDDLKFYKNILTEDGLNVTIKKETDK